MRKITLKESIQHKVDQVILTRRDKKVLFSLFIYKAYNAIGGDKLARLSYLSWGGGSNRQGRLSERGVLYKLKIAEGAFIRQEGFI